MRNYAHLDNYLNVLQSDVYEQPEDSGHSKYAKEVIDRWCSKLVGCQTVLDLGCGSGFCEPMFARHRIVWKGVTLGPDYLVCEEKGLDVVKEDFNFLSFPDNSFDLLFARHSFEHTFSPLVSLMEWRRVTKQWVCIIVPNPANFTVRGKNHLSVLYSDQLKWLFEVAKLNLIWEDINDFEYRYMLEKVQDDRQ